MTVPVAGWEAAARQAFDAALLAGNPAAVTRDAMARVELPPTAVIAVGKAAVGMAQAVRDTGCDAPGLVITTDENFAEIAGMTCFASAHPVPDRRGIEAAAAVSELAAALGPRDHLLLLISGGGSALLPAPAEGMDLADKQALNEALLASGLDIHEMNAVRRLFSTLKGGRLARLANPARITQFLLSDVPGDRFESIASGPAVADPVPLDEALALIRGAGLDGLPFVKERLKRIEEGAADLPVRPGDPVLDKVGAHLLASNDLCRVAARDAVAATQGGGIEVELPPLSGEASDCARELARRLVSASSSSAVWAVTGGETTVRLGASPGAGGRAQEMGVAFAAAMHDLAPGRDWVALIGGTDGRDGPTDAAGAVITSAHPFTPGDAAAALAGHDCYPFLKRSGALLMVPPTGTNLGDIAVFIVGGEG